MECFLFLGYISSATACTRKMLCCRERRNCMNKFKQETLSEYKALLENRTASYERLHLLFDEGTHGVEKEKEDRGQKAAAKVIGKHKGKQSPDLTFQNLVFAEAQQIV